MKIESKNIKLYITHGDPNWANIMINKKGYIYFIDWDTIGLRPSEQDLLFFTGEIEEEFFLEYSKYRKSLNILPELFGYYSFIWNFQEILEFSEKILKTNESLEQSKLDLIESKKYIISKDNKNQLIERMKKLKSKIRLIFRIACNERI